MYYKLSNIVGVKEFETAFNANFKYPEIFKGKPLINGFDEEILPIITDNSPNQIQYGIWGILPKNYRENWETFQSVYNTLNLSVTDINNSKHFSLNQRCIVLVSGFFYSYIFKGELYPFYTYPKSKKPFALAGIYNTTEDGYITFSVILTPISKEASKYHNISKLMPLVITPENQDKWLSNDYKLTLYDPLIDFNSLNFQAHPIAREFYKNDITFKSFLDPADYGSLAIPFLT